MNLNYIRINDKTIVVRCNQCHTPEFVDITDEEIVRWKHGEKIQDVIPLVSADERELLISGICGTCFDELFKE